MDWAQAAVNLGFLLIGAVVTYGATTKQARAERATLRDALTRLIVSDLKDQHDRLKAGGFLDKSLDASLWEAVRISYASCAVPARQLDKAAFIYSMMRQWNLQVSQNPDYLESLKGNTLNALWQAVECMREILTDGKEPQNKPARSPSTEPEGGG